jgi:two-component system, chemotaxis family, chemotaxis protein CheY
MNPRILVVDDSKVMRKAIRRWLSTFGDYTITEASDGSQAIALFRPGEFDLVLTDWNMPGKSGLDVVREIRSKDHKIPIIMSTSVAEEEHVIEAIQAGVSDYLLKPVNPGALQEKLVKYVSKSQQVESQKCFHF